MSSFEVERHAGGVTTGASDGSRQRRRGRLKEMKSECGRSWQTCRGRRERNCGVLGAGVGTEPGPLDVLLELTERRDFFFTIVSYPLAYIWMSSCFTPVVKQSPVNQSQACHVWALLYSNIQLTFIHRYTCITRFTGTFSHCCNSILKI